VPPIAAEGYQMLLEFCEQEQIAYDVCGKIIVATQDFQLPLLDVIFDRGEANGLKGLHEKWILLSCASTSRMLKA
jgi:L-2-hydroxyglutarate oxidase LhgO